MGNNLEKKTDTSNMVDNQFEVAKSAQSAYKDMHDDDGSKKHRSRSSQRSSIHQPDDVLQKVDQDMFMQKRSKSHGQRGMFSNQDDSVNNIADFDEDEYRQLYQGRKDSAKRQLNQLADEKLEQEQLI